MKPTIRDALVNSARDMCNLADSFQRSAEIAALQSLRAGDPAEAADLKQRAMAELAKSEAYKVAMKKFDEVRQRLESGELA